MINKIFMRRVHGLLFEPFAILIAVVFLSLTTSAVAAEITYTGKAEALQSLPSWLGDYPSSLFPGTTNTPLAGGNRVTIDYEPSAADTANPEYVYGGLSELKQAANNSVALLSGNVAKNIFGGFSVKDNAEDNIITIDGGSVGGGVLCGFSVFGDAVNNIVTINGGAIKHGVLGGLGSGVVKGNAITINGGIVDGEIIGGMGDKGDISGNIITVIGGFIGDSVVGGDSDKAKADGNAVGNTVIMDGGSVHKDVYGGRCWDSSATNNAVTISNMAIGEDVCGGFSWNNNSTGNTVTISSGSVGGKISGGRSHKGDVSGNTVTISGDAALGDVFGGLSGDGHAKGNTVNIGGGPNLLKADIFGGFTSSNSADAVTGNTLNFKSSGISAVGVAHFEYYNFFLPVDVKSGDTMLMVKDIVEFAGTIVEVSLQGKTQLAIGDRVALINIVNGVFDSPKNKTSTSLLDGVLYEFAIHTDNNNLWAELISIRKGAK